MVSPWGMSSRTAAHPSTSSSTTSSATSASAGLLRGLTSDEVAVAARWAQGVGTWAESALSVRLPAAYGERVRRKLHRLGARQVQRAVTAGEVR